MAENEIEIAATPEEVWRVLSTPEIYDQWVVGAQNVRDADESWPAVGSKLHHSTGVGPLTVDDETVVEASEPLRRLVLLAKIKALGQFRIVLELSPAGTGTRLVMQEDPVGGLAEHVPGTDAAITGRNTVSLKRLAELAEHPA